jgi:hypothetical protein
MPAVALHRPKHASDALQVIREQSMTYVTNRCCLNRCAVAAAQPMIFAQLRFRIEHSRCEGHQAFELTVTNTEISGIWNYLGSTDTENLVVPGPC